MPSIERRRVQKTGSSSYIVTLPKDWVDLMGLKSGDYVVVEKHGDKLLITPSTSEPLQLKTTVKVSSPIDVSEIFRVVLGAYLSGSTIITVVFEPKIPGLSKLIADLKNLARIKLAGIEVVEETYNSVSFKILLDLRELPIQSALKRLHIIVNNMLNDTMVLMQTGNKDIANNVVQRDDEADRFHHMVVRELSMALLDIRIQHELGLSSPVEALSYRIIARNMERIADHTVNIAKRIVEIGGQAPPFIQELLAEAIDIYNSAMNTVYTLSRGDVEKVMERVRGFVAKTEQVLLEKIVPSTLPDHQKAPLVLVVESIKRIARYSNGICESVLNIKASKSHEIILK